MNNYLNSLKKQVLDGYKITKSEALKLTEISDLEAICRAADEIREKFCGNKFDLCTIINAKSGRCSENCTFCAQSAHFKTDCETYDLLDEKSVLKKAYDDERSGAHRFSLVASGRGLKGNDQDMKSVEDIYESLAKNTDLHLCASFGIADKEALEKLRDSGVKTYHHNLESSRNHFPKICTTHSYDDRIKTIKEAREVGLEVCSGGIFGMGESIEDRIDMAFDLRELGVASVPINVLTPIMGTPLEAVLPVDPEEIIKTIAIYRFILPDVYLRYAGGRKLLGEFTTLGLRGGINSALTGDFLTTAGDSINSDIDMIKSCGFELR